MEIVETNLKQVSESEVKYNYIYRLIKSGMSVYIKNELTLIQTYGIEVERQDVVDGVIVRLERDCVKSISPQRHKVHGLLKILYDNNVSPVHLIDVLGEYIDRYVDDFDKEMGEIVSC